MNIRFQPEPNTEEILKATQEYIAIWQEYNQQIIDTIQEVSGLAFVETKIEATVFEGMSSSHPLRLRASYDSADKKATLVHELCHRLCAGHGLKPVFNNEDTFTVTVHKTINLILYDILSQLWGKEFADKNVAIESSRSDEYAQAWKWALSLTRDERQAKFKKIKP